VGAAFLFVFAADTNQQVDFNGATLIFVSAAKVNYFQQENRGFNTNIAPILAFSPVLLLKTQQRLAR